MKSRGRKSQASVLSKGRLCILLLGTRSTSPNPSPFLNFIQQGSPVIDRSSQVRFQEQESGSNRRWIKFHPDRAESAESRRREDDVFCEE